MSVLDKLIDSVESEAKKKLSKIERIVTNTLDGKYLRICEVEMFSKYLDFENDERIELIYIYSDNFEPLIKINNEIIILITNKRIVKLENGGKYIINRKDIVKCSHTKNGLFKWDSLLFQLSNNKIESINIYHETTCAYFSNYINSNIKNIIR